MSVEVLTAAEMREADRRAIEGGVGGLQLMEAAGRGVADEICARWSPRRALVLCGPGNNGGDGFVAARRLQQAEWDVDVALLTPRDRLSGDAETMAQRWRGAIEPFSEKALEQTDLVVDAMFGTGLGRPIEGGARTMVRAANASSLPVVSVDLPTGLSADNGRPLGEVVAADLTVTFFRKKLGHLLFPGRGLCGELRVVDIGISPDVLSVIRPTIFENSPALWREALAGPDADAHKYDRGHVLVISGPLHRTGAARLAATSALRAGAGLQGITVVEAKRLA
ncbi:MAG: NAD(P)H-hydrate epimerase [Pseudomonadota bacterium]